jgi:hypothetical protein
MTENLERGSNRFRSWLMGVASGLLILFTFRSIGAAGGAKQVSISKAGGAIDVDEAPGGAKLFTMGGNIHLGAAGGDSRLKTMGGDIDVDAFTGSLHAVTMAGSIRARLASTERYAREIELSSNQGEIELTVPKGLPMNVEICLAYTDNQSEHYRVISDLPLQTTQTPDWNRWHGTPRKYIYAKGRTGNGATHVAITTINGNVRLAEQ